LSSFSGVLYNLDPRFNGENDIKKVKVILDQMKHAEVIRAYTYDDIMATIVKNQEYVAKNSKDFKDF
jgi:hypothetical protein